MNAFAAALARLAAGEDVSEALLRFANATANGAPVDPEDAALAAAYVHAVLQTPAGRRVAGLPPRRRGATYPRPLTLGDPLVLIALDLLRGRITRAQALRLASDALAVEGRAPDPRTAAARLDAAVDLARPICNLLARQIE